MFKFFGSLNSEIIAIDDPLCFKVKSDVVGGIHSGPIITVNDGIHIRISAKPGAKNSAILGNALCLFITLTEFWKHIMYLILYWAVSVCHELVY